MKLIDLYYKVPYITRYPIFIVTGVIQARSRYGKEFKSIYANLMKNLYLSEEEINILQFNYMKKLLCYAYANVPYYKKIFDEAGFNPDYYRDVEDLKKVPILTKEIIRENFRDLIAKNFKNKSITKNRSGGTTGKPIEYCLPKELKGDFNYATLYRFYSWAGVEFREPRVSIAGRLITKKPPYAMYNPAENQLYVCAHYLEESNLADILKSMKKFRPSFIQGHPSAVSIIAEYIKKQNVNMPVKAVFTTSENLYSDQRNVIEDAFQCKVFDTYGMGEMVAMASECTQHNGYHLAPEYGYTEIINTDHYEDGIGEIISTSLQNYAMPLIRYKTGDIGKFKQGKCPCGFNFPMLEKISGRIDDVIKLRNGKTILPLTIRIRMKNAGITDFQIVQIKEDSFDVNILGITANKNTESNIREVLEDIFGSEVKIQIHYSKDQILTQSGKKQMIIRKLSI